MYLLIEFYFYLCVYISVCHMCVGTHEGQRGIRSSRTGVIDGYETHHVDARN